MPLTPPHYNAVPPLLPSDEQFRLLVEGAKDHAIFMIDTQGQIVSWNPGVERILGYSEAEWISQPAALIFTEEDCVRGEPERELETAAATGRAEDVRWHVRKDGTRFWADGVLTALYDEAGRLYAFGKVMRDATRQFEDRARGAERAEILRLALDAVVLMDHEGRVAEWNPAAERIFGYHRDEALGQEMASLIIPPDLRERHRNGLERYRETGIGNVLGTRFEITAIRRDRSEFPVELAIARVPHTDPPRFAGFIRDITEAKRAEHALRRQAELIELAHDAIFATDLDGRVLFWNRGAEAQYGWTREEAIGQIAPELLRAVFPIPLTEATQQLKTTGHWEGEVVHTRKDGIQILVSARWVLQWEGPQGAAEAVVLRVNHDITEERKAALERAAHTARQERIAETLQRSLLLVPPPDAFAGLEVHTRYEAASEDALVGGDFADVFAVDDARVALVMGDVTGKGLPAATYTAEIKFALRAFLREDTDPAQALSRLNRYLVEGRRLDAHPGNTYVSFCVAVVHTATGKVECSSAGAEPPLLVRRNGEVAEEIAGPGPLLGVDRESTFHLATAQMEHGDLLVLTTDGVTEARRGRAEFFGVEGLARVVKDTMGIKPLGEVANAIVSTARAFAGGLQKDDVCLLLACRRL